MTTLSVMVKRPADLSGEERQAWDDYRAQNPILYSPYFHLGYTELLGKMRSDVHVLIVYHNMQPVAFLPFQAKIKPSGKLGFARPIGAPMTDYHGFICSADTKFDALEALKQAGFGAFHFSSLVNDKTLLQPYGRTNTVCSVIDVTSGADSWRQSRGSSYRRHLKTNRRRIRKSNELGARRLEWNVQDEHVFAQLLSWKHKKFAESGKYDVLSADWTQAILNSLWRRERCTGLRAEMHALYFGDTLAAIDLGITDGITFHSWMVAYNDEFSHMAPGIQLLEELIDASEMLGYKFIDLGQGIEGYKRHYAHDSIQTSSGFLAAAGPAATLSRLYEAAEYFGEKKLGHMGLLPGKIRRRYSQIRACEPNFTGRAKAILSAVKSTAK